MQSTFAKNREQSRTFHKGEKSMEIVKANKGLAERLFEIQLGNVRSHLFIV